MNFVIRTRHCRMRQLITTVGKQVVKTLTSLMLTALVATLVSGCMASSQLPLTAFQRNVGPGSTVGGVASNDLGRGRPGDEDVPGVSTAGGSGSGPN
jgi:hypothetical protein